MIVELRNTADVTTGNKVWFHGLYVLRFLFTQRCSDSRLVDIVGACRATAVVWVRHFEYLRARDFAEQFSRLSANTLGIGEMAGIVVGDANARLRYRRDVN